MKHLYRFLLIMSFFLISTVIMHTIKAPEKLPNPGFRVACMPAEAAPHDDKPLIPYAQLAHTSAEDNGSSKLWRCYFRFAPRDLVCIPKEVALRRSDPCPNFPPVEGIAPKTCYLLNNKFQTVVKLLQKKPAVTINSYITSKNALVKTWQEVRDILLGKK